MDLCYCNLVKVERRYLDEAALFHIFTQAKQKNRGEERERERERERENHYSCFHFHYS